MNGSRLVDLVSGLADLLETHPDYSLYGSFRKLSEHRSIHPLSEDVLKGNAENSYCRSYIYELAKAIYLEEAKSFSSLISHTPDLGSEREFLRAEAKRIREEFYRIPLKELQPDISRHNPLYLAEILKKFEILTGQPRRTL